MSAEPPSASNIDTSKFPEDQRRALEMTESSRDLRETSGLAASLLAGNPDFNTLLPFPEQSEIDRERGNEFLRKLKTFLEQETDPDQIDATGEIPQSVIEGLGRLGAFGIKIPNKYGGLGLSQTNYSRSAMLLGQHCGNLTALLSAHQSIGVPQPLIQFGTDAQKEKYLPLFAKGQISAFALTEEEVGSDPSKMKTTAKLNKAGSHYILNGEKLWCTNGLLASHIVVVARTPSQKNPMATTAFIVNMNWPGVEIVNRCHFMGLRALYNGVVRFNQVQIPLEDVVYKVGKGLKVALSTLNTGRLTLPAACAGMMQRCLDITLRWCNEREQWGKLIGQHAAIAAKIADLAADTFATEAMVRYTSALVDADMNADIRLEAAMAKLWGTQAAWHSIDQTLQIKGGRGYETADSLRQRGQRPDPIERMMRDCRINLIFEGSSEIMSLFIAREMLDPHLRIGGAALDSRKPMTERFVATLRAGLHYSKWYTRRCWPGLAKVPAQFDPHLQRQLRVMGRLSQKLSRSIFKSMLRHGPKLEREQLLLTRLVSIGTELFALSTACARTQWLIENAPPQVSKQALQTTEYLCIRGRQRIRQYFSDLHLPSDHKGYQLARKLLKTQSHSPATAQPAAASEHPKLHVV
ncbi:MAG: alkylation response protein AidB-like acyl-CoA dehydrogenase [Lentimonas sp.]|jgi:alkylation response protein AidB-like acyl-CoA dehydrogenase